MVTSKNKNFDSLLVDQNVYINLLEYTHFQI